MVVMRSDESRSPIKLDDLVLSPISADAERNCIFLNHIELKQPRNPLLVEIQLAMGRKPSKPKKPSSSPEVDLPAEQVVQGLLRDLDGLSRLQQFQTQLIQELRHTLESMQKNQS